MNNENEIERITGIVSDYLDGAIPECEVDILVLKLLEQGIGDKKQAAKSAVRDFITKLSYVRKSTVDDNGEPIVTVGVVNFDDMVDMYHELYGVDE